PVGSKLRPVGGDRLLILDQASLGLEVEGSGGRRLDHREGGEERRPLHLPARRLVSNTAPDIDNPFTILIDRNLHADFAVLANRRVDRLLKHSRCLRSADRGCCHRSVPLCRLAGTTMPWSASPGQAFLILPN